mmetsp:Transcript_53169/g.172940  ORF Transcript_53169/g.172940 Transcript_53169/m.172940 type:complete len:202 (-) Transcript_53169:4131-4736(-)
MWDQIMFVSSKMSTVESRTMFCRNEKCDLYKMVANCTSVVSSSHLRTSAVCPSLLPPPSTSKRCWHVASRTRSAASRIFCGTASASLPCGEAPCGEAMLLRKRTTDLMFHKTRATSPGSSFASSIPLSLSSLLRFLACSSRSLCLFTMSASNSSTRRMTFILSKLKGADSKAAKTSANMLDNTSTATGNVAPGENWLLSNL